jgi:hypothetical protein
MVVYRNILGKSTQTSKLTSFILDHFGKQVKAPYLSRLCRKTHLSSRLISRAGPSEASLTRFNEAVRFIKSVQQKQLPSYKIVCMDKTHIYCDSRFERHWAPKGR